jgi:hypothetical protein
VKCVELAQKRRNEPSEEENNSKELHVLYSVFYNLIKYPIGLSRNSVILESQGNR